MYFYGNFILYNWTDIEVKKWSSSYVHVSVG